MRIAIFGIASVLALVGCDSVPRGPVASTKGLYTNPLRDCSGGVLVYVIGARQETGGVVLDFAVEGNRDEASSVATIVSERAHDEAQSANTGYIFFSPESRRVTLLKPHGQWPATSFGCLLPGPATREVVNDGSQSRFLFSVPLRTQSVSGHAIAWLDPASVNADVDSGDAKYKSFVTLGGGTERASGRKPQKLFVEPAGVEIVPQPRDWPADER